MLNLGDAFAAIATPIARGLGMDCIDPETKQLRPDSPCAKRKEAMNQFGNRVQGYFLKPQQHKKGELMKFRCQMIVIVESEKAEDVIGKVKPPNGDLYTYNVTPVVETPPNTGTGTGTGRPGVGQTMTFGQKSPQPKG